MGVQDWADALSLDRPVDATVFTTALHYLPECTLTTVYGDLAHRLCPGGVLVNGDPFSSAHSWRARLAAHLGRRHAQRSGSGPHEG